MRLNGRSCWVVNIRTVRAEELSLEAIGRFVAGSEDIRFEGEGRQQLYGWVERVLVEHEYARQGRAARGLLRPYLAKMTALSRAGPGGTPYAADRALHGQRAGPGEGLSATAFRVALYAGRYRAAGLGR